MSEPKAGDRYTKNGIEFTVHEVRDGEVYGVRYRVPVDDAAAAASLDNGEWPEGCLGACRVSVEAFECEIVGAVKKEGGER